MTDPALEQVWGIIKEGFEEVLGLVRQRLPDLEFRARRHRSQAFLFWAYGEYTNRERAITISFNLQRLGNTLHLWGDVSREDGFVLADLISETFSMGEALD